ncbi:MAG TPA: C40 family peptidase [Actinomycetes bacterium]|nr:C40 family peptidase [Actinomycetes bacterium]
MAALALAGLLAPIGPHALADSHPVFPSQAQVDASKSAAASTAGRVGQIEGQLAAATARADRLATEAEQAVEAYNGAQVRLQEAQSAAVQAQQEAAAARTKVGQARAELGRFAAAAYRSGGDLGGLTSFFLARNPSDLMSRAAALQSIGNSRRAALESFRSAQAYAVVLDKRAAALVERRQQVAEQVARAKTAAEARLAAQEQSVGQIAAQRKSLVRQLAAARHTTVQLEQARQAGLARQRAEAARREAERRAREAAARAEAQRQAAAAKAAEDARAAEAQRARDQAAQQAQQSSSDSSGSSGDSSGGGGGGGGGGGAPSGPPSGYSAGSASGAAAAVAYARSQLGKPYQWAADGPATFDCSGLTMRAWEQGGVYLPHYSVAQYEQAQKIAISDLQPGDLVFFASSSDYHSIYHVALYVGGGEMIEAPYTGADVRISSIWRSSLFGAARP